MGGGCACKSSIKKYFFCSGEYVIKQEKDKDIDIGNNKNKMPEKNINIIPKEDDVDIAKAKVIHNNGKMKILINGNDINQINNNNQINNSFDNINDKKNVSDNKIKCNSSSYIGSELSKKKSDNVSVENNTSNINNNNTSKQYNFGSKHQTMQKKVLEKENLKKAETNYNYNLGEHNFIFINISGGNSAMKNDSEKIESTTPKMAVDRDHLDDMVRGDKPLFSHFCMKKSSIDKHSKNNSNNNNQRIKPDFTVNYMNNYSEEWLKAINSLRKHPESFIKYIDSMINNNIQRKDDDIFLVSQNVDEKVKLMENYLLIFEQIKTILKDIINSKISIDLEELKYNEELEIDIESARFINSALNQTNVERSSISNDRYLSQTNHCSFIKKKKKIDPNSTLDLSDDKIANLILVKRMEIKNKYPYSIFKLNIIKDININILIQISMELMFNNQYNDKKMLNEVIFSPKYKNFAVSWANELNRKFISISCFA
jgi:hypothetical protein